MCINSSEMISYNTFYSVFRFRSLSKRNDLRVRGLNRKRRSARETKRSGGVEMEIKNLKLYMENQSIMEENKRLKKKALLLNEENQALLSQLQHKFSQQNTKITN